MSKAKEEFYVVWKGRQSGIFESWEACRTQVHGFEGALYRCFPTLPLAKRALKEGPGAFGGSHATDYIVDHDLTKKPFDEGPKQDTAI